MNFEEFHFLVTELYQTRPELRKLPVKVWDTRDEEFAEVEDVEIYKGDRDGDCVEIKRIF